MAVNTGQLSFVSLSAQPLQEKNTATDPKSDAEAQMEKENTEQGVPTDSEYPKKPYTVQSLLDFMNNERFSPEYRYHAMQLAAQLPRDEYIRFLKSAIEVNDGQIVTYAILELFRLDEQSMSSSINKRILSLPEYWQGTIVIRFIQEQPIDPKYQFSSLSRQLLQQLLTPTPGNIKGSSVSKPEVKLSSEMTEEDQGKAADAGYVCLLLVASTPVLTEDDHALLKAARRQFPQERRVWLAGSLAKDITGSDLKIGQPIYTNTREYTPLRVAVALALSPIDTKAEQFFSASIEHLLSTASKREDAITKSFANVKSLDSDIDLLPSIKFHVELQYLSWLRFYNGANARTLILKCLSSKSHSV
ncbi:MAG: hypothetical protein ABI210_09435, partial [Abditibacteriaceae bacterium]